MQSEHRAPILNFHNYKLKKMKTQFNEEQIEEFTIVINEAMEKKFKCKSYRIW